MTSFLKGILSRRPQKGVKKSRLLRFSALAVALLLATGTVALQIAPTLSAEPGLPILVNYAQGTVKEISDVNFETVKYQSFYDAAYSDTEGFPRTRYPEDAAGATQSSFAVGGTSGHFNGGTATPDHIVINDDQLRFFGYASTPYFDWVFSDDYDITSLEFDFFPGRWNFHCFKRTGFFLKSRINPDGTLTGYFLSIGSSRVGTVAQNSSYYIDPTDGSIISDLTYDMFYVENMDIDAYNQFITDHSGMTETFADGATITKGPINDDNGNPLPTPNLFLEGENFPEYSGTYQQRGRLGDWWTLETDAGGQMYPQPHGAYQGSDPNYLDYYFDGDYGLPKGTTITKLFSQDSPQLGLLSSNSVQTHFRISVSDNDIAVYITLNADQPSPVEQLIFYEQISGVTDGGIGFFTQYLAHACQMLTHITYSGVELTDANGERPAQATVRFRPYGGSPTALKPDETMNGYVGYEYAINPPPTITYNGQTYYYYRHSRDNGLTPLDPLTYQQWANQNVTTLYYVLAPTASKSARVIQPSGTTNNGTPTAPVSVNYGDIIEYTVHINNPNTSQINNFGAAITDLLPAGLSYISSSNSGQRTVDAATGRDRVTWTIATLPMGATTRTVQARVTDPYALFENTATVTLRDAVGPIEEVPPIVTNATYHESTMDPLSIVKEARKDGTITNNPGTQALPVLMEFGDIIEYTLIVTNPNATCPTVAGTVTDYLPVGLEYISDDHSAQLTKTVIGSREHLSWTIPAIPQGNTTIKVRVLVNLSNTTFVNRAAIGVNVSELAPEYSNETFHKTGSLPVTATKSARVLPAGATDNGRANAPVEVESNNEVEYTINVNNPNDVNEVSELLFNYDYTQRGYDSAYTAALSASYNNGVATPDHVVRSGANISFNGYSNTGYFDLLFSDAVMVDKIELDFKSTAWNYHCFKRTGFFVNSSITNGKLTGYAIVIGSVDANMSQSQSESSYYYSLWYIEDLDIATAHYTSNVNPAPNFAWKSAAVATELARGPAMSQTDPETHFRIQTTPTTIEVFMSRPSVGTAETRIFNQTIPQTFAQGIGFFMQNISHSCTRLTHVEFNNVLLSVKNIVTYETTTSDLLPEGMTVVSTEPPATSVTTDPETGRQRVTWYNASLPGGTTSYKIIAKVEPNRRLRTVDYENMATVQMTGHGIVGTNTTYHQLNNEMILHIRQMVLDRNGQEIELPAMGYYVMSNDGKGIGLESTSGVDGITNTPFVEYLLPLSTDPYYTIATLLPQYYSYAGYVLTTSPGTAHNSANRTTGNIRLDYTNSAEQWLTVYLLPKTTAGKFSWDVHSNDFGKLRVP